jgi:hypothetical protein
LLAPGRPAELLTIPPHNRGRGLQPDADTTPIIDIGAPGGNSPDGILAIPPPP